MIGRRADIAIIDDPIRSQAEADSREHRDQLWEWYRSDLIPRLKPGARIALIMTRWHQDDLCGRLLECAPGEWHCLRLPALADADDQLQRTPGEALWPEWEDVHALIRRRKSIGDRAWFAQYQQTPRPDTGTLFHLAKISVVDRAPNVQPGRAARGWDLAATAATQSNDPDWSVGIKMMIDGAGRFTVLDVARLRGTPREVEEAISNAARVDGMQVRIGLPEDPGQAGKSQAAYLTRLLAGFNVRASRETGSKLTRATPVASQIEQGNVSMLRGNWNNAFLDELRDFPFGTHDDQVNALARAFTMLTEASVSARVMSSIHMER